MNIFEFTQARLLVMVMMFTTATPYQLVQLFMGGKLGATVFTVVLEKVARRRSLMSMMMVIVMVRERCVFVM